MTLSDLKSQLDIIEIAQELGLHPDKNGKCLCPFHKDTKPSLQFSKEKQIVTCFSSNCDVGTMDVIELVKKYKLWELPQTVAWLQQRVAAPKSVALTSNNITTETKKENYQNIYNTLTPKLSKSSKAREYLTGRHINYKTLDAGFNTGKDWEHLKYCIVFPLKDAGGEIVSLYGRSIYNNNASKHYYTKNRKGLHPCYPFKNTKQLIITESIIDTITLQHHFLSSKEKQQQISILTAYGTNGLTQEHFKAIEQLNTLQEIIFFFDGDLSGDLAVDKYTLQLKKTLPKVSISKVETLANEDINSLLDSHDPQILTHLFDGRKVIYEFSMREILSKKQEKESPVKPNLQIKENHSIYTDTYLKIELMGKIDLKDFSKLKVTAVIYNQKQLAMPPSRNNMDLYNDEQIDKIIRKIASKIEVGTSTIREALDTITRQLETYRLEQKDQKPQKKQRYILRAVSVEQQIKAKEVLLSANLTKILIQKLQDTGIIGEQKNALFLWTIALSRKMNKTLHAMVQGTSGSGKTHLIHSVSKCLYDQNKIKIFTRVTDKSFYNYGEQDLCHCCIILEDYDGLTLEAQLAWRELQSNGCLSSSVTIKNELTGEMTTGERYVYGPISSLVATTHFSVYEDNETRVFIIAIDESEAQTARVLEYMAQKAAKIITDQQEEKIRQQLQDIAYMIKPYKVKNPYRLELPKTTKHRRRLTQMLHDYIEQITILHQYQRSKENQMLVAQIEDLEIAIDLMFNSIILKTDELDGILRQFYENLKKYIESKGKEYEFTRREIRQKFRISKTQMLRYMDELEELEYIHKSSTGSRNSYRYKISYWDNIEKLRKEIRQHLQNQIDTYKNNTSEN